VPSLIDTLLDRLAGLPSGTVYAVIGALAAVENVFPPVPADTAVAVGAFLSHYGTVALGAVFLVTWGSNVSAAASVYWAGRTFGRQFFTGRLGRRLLHPRHLERMEQLYRRYGAWGIFLSRFVPGVRAVVPPFAGVARLGMVKTLLPLALASGIWYGLLTWLVGKTARRIEEAARIVADLNWILLGAAVLAAGGLVWFLRQRTPSP
jgi:membrane protein DedA with SNARE-associated domain